MLSAADDDALGHATRPEVQEWEGVPHLARTVAEITESQIRIKP